MGAKVVYVVSVWNEQLKDHRMLLRINERMA